MIESLLSSFAGGWSEPAGLLLLAAVSMMSALAFLPRPPICMMGGAVFGLVAFPVVLAGTTFGAVIAFLLSRYLLRSRAHDIAGRRPRLKLIMDAVDAEGWRLLGLVRLASPVPGTASNFLFGLTRMSLWTYIAATALGSAPQILAFVYIGIAGRMALDAPSVSTAKLVFAAAGLALAFVAVFLVTRRAKSILSMTLARQAGPQS
jgi:uncharacterized membrane protein YdjX (TVP38/TMEM64 family)